MLEVGDINRFKKPGNYSSCRVVSSQRKKKGENKYLSWAYTEAANFVIHFLPQAENSIRRKKPKKIM